MMLMTHALIGAAGGHVVRNRPLAALIGAASHALGDLLPHREASLKQDAPYAAAALVLLAACFGPTSPEMAGALGA